MGVTMWHKAGELEHVDGILWLMAWFLSRIVLRHIMWNAKQLMLLSAYPICYES
jgi:hypothetical protein